MNLRVFIIFLFFITTCSSNKVTYWCGDHACLNKKEKEAYFKKTMIVEIKQSNSNKGKTISEIEEIKKRAKKEEAKRIDEEKSLAKLEKINQKRLKKEEKALAKQNKLKEKRLKKEEKALAKALAKEEKLFKKKEKKEKKSLLENLNSKNEKNKKILSTKSDNLEKIESLIEKKTNEVIISKKSFSSLSDNDMNNFEQILKRVYSENNLKPYPDINDIPE